VPPFDDEFAAMRTLEDIGQARFGGGISYTWAVMPSGRIYQWHSVGRRGAHTKGRNSIARAVVLVGNYENQFTTGGQREAVANLLRHAEQQGWITKARLDGGHRNAPGAATACPGLHGMAAVVDINRLAASEDDDMPSVDEIWGHSVRNLNGDTVRVDQVVVATEARVAELQREMDELKKLVNELQGGTDG
jgi:N-acetylmuramoyl-L-alanine amidase